MFTAVASGLHDLTRAMADLDQFLRPDRENVDHVQVVLRDVLEIEEGAIAAFPCES